MIDWVQANDTMLWWLAAISAITFVATLIVVPWLIVRIPEDYFEAPRRHRMPWADQHAVVRVVLLIGKNLLACVLLVAGVAMLLLPGQGILTLLVGILLLNFPGKYELERWLIRRHPVLRSVNWLRRRAGHGPLRL
ncbi:MAG TPA: PGPGW domain-containing protein [Thermoguttaceae bacterium]|nr:PGPGW domain-containing protein [Thermoguttaceae bacterium]